jgi:hypothetical protein
MIVFVEMRLAARLSVVCCSLSFAGLVACSVLLDTASLTGGRRAGTSSGAGRSGDENGGAGVEAGAAGDGAGNGYTDDAGASNAEGGSAPGSGGGSAGASGASTGTGGGSGTAGGAGTGAVAGAANVPPCQDGKLSPGETDIDCGGVSGCPRCASGETCQSVSDCNGGACTSGRCRAPSCTDGLRNQDEIGVDCDGVCPGCAPCDKNAGALSNQAAATLKCPAACANFGGWSGSWTTSGGQSVCGCKDCSL